eukprot:gene12651-13854_t
MVASKKQPQPQPPSKMSQKEDEDFVNHLGRSREYTNSIYVINTVKHGGALKYVYDLENYFSEIHFIYITQENQLHTHPINSKSIVLINHLTSGDISITDIINLKLQTKAYFILIIHDFFYLGLKSPYYHIEYGKPLPENETHASYLWKKSFHPVVCDMLQSMDVIIHQNQFSFLEFQKKGCSSLHNSIVIPPADYPVQRSKNVIYRPIINNEINLGMMTSNTVIKGQEMIKILKYFYINYKNFHIRWKIVGYNNIPLYNDSLTSFFNLIVKENIHSLLYFNKYGETFSFALTKYLNSQLPILYNNIGSFKDRMNSIHYNSNHDTNSSHTDVGFFPIFQNEEEYLQFIQEYSYILTSKKGSNSHSSSNNNNDIKKNQKVKPVLALQQEEPRSSDDHPHNHCNHSACKKFEVFLEYLINQSDHMMIPHTVTSAKAAETLKNKIINNYELQLKSLNLSNQIEMNSTYQSLFLPYYSLKHDHNNITHKINQMHIDNNKQNHLFIITSKINVSNIPFSYIKSRSIYTIQERFQQTLDTIHSIKTYLSPSNDSECQHQTYLILIDNSVLPKHYINQLKHAGINLLINPVNDPILNYYTDLYAYKGFAEIAQLIYAYNQILQYMHMYHFSNIFKITGRYTLTKSFNINYYSSIHSMIFKRNMKLMDMKYYYTCFYKIESSFFHEYFTLLKKLFLMKNDYIYHKKALNLEEEIPLILEFNFTEVPVDRLLGIRQNIAVWKDTTET